ncbi:MAG: hypothetical protein JNK11_07010 [Alphaproteobacteria bacterium]|nr:hypothetical protein [Alphaproteobacteria bacterium]
MSKTEPPDLVPPAGTPEYEAYCAWMRQEVAIGLESARTEPLVDIAEAVERGRRPIRDAKAQARAGGRGAA